MAPPFGLTSFNATMSVSGGTTWTYEHPVLGAPMGQLLSGGGYGACILGKFLISGVSGACTLELLVPQALYPANPFTVLNVFTALRFPSIDLPPGPVVTVLPTSGGGLATSFGGGYWTGTWSMLVATTPCNPTTPSTDFTGPITIVSAGGLPASVGPAGTTILQAMSVGALTPRSQISAYIPPDGTQLSFANNQSLHSLLAAGIVSGDELASTLILAGNYPGNLLS